jgi:hypothetical protein
MLQQAGRKRTNGFQVGYSRLLICYSYAATFHGYQVCAT